MISTVFAQDISNNTFGKGLRIAAKDSSMSMKFGLRFSTLYEGFYTPETKDYQDNLLIRRFRLKFDGFVYSPKLAYKVEIGVSNRDIGGVSEYTNGASRLILDAVLKWNFAGNFTLWFGQTKLPGNRERVVSSQKLQFVDRSLLNSRFNLDRDKGIQLHHHHKIGKVVIREVASVSKGEGRNVTVKNKDGYDYTGRIELLPFGNFSKKGDYFESDLAREPTPKLALGATYDYNQGAVRSRGQLGTWLDDSRDLKTFFFDAVYKHNGFSATTEYANRQTKGSAVVATDSTGNITQAFYTGKAFNGQLAYLFKNNFEIAGRYTSLVQDIETQRKDSKQYTLGFSKYIVGHHLKAQTDFTLINTVDTPDIWMFRFQIEMAF
ncbi:MAG: OprO/OprP family phosphate-selective porin [Cyclobacteriaceae bacterium]|nr:OprO/OprP family phosphate-selective porin [Cyclobacteriaceae bacterium]